LLGATNPALQANRFFDTKEDMTYLSAFGHSLRAEISRIETISSDIAKGKFISSVSHELRTLSLAHNLADLCMSSDHLAEFGLNSHRACH